MLTLLDFLWPRKRNKPVASNSLHSGLEVVYDGSKANVDIVAVHGLWGDSLTTWKASNGTMWLQHLLPSILPGSRIMTFGYDTEIPNSVHGYRKSISSHAKNLITALTFYREGTQSIQRPLIFIGHSLGGLVIKSVLLRSALAKNDEGYLRTIKPMTLGILFLGTPHHHGSLRDIVNTIAASHGRTEFRESEWRCLEAQLDQFKSISSSFMIFCGYETRPTKSTNSVIVHQSSGTMRNLNPRDSTSVPLDKHHHGLCKFDGRDDEDFAQIMQLFRRLEKRRIQQTSSKGQESPTKVPDPGHAVVEDDFKIPFVLDGRSQNPEFTGRKIALEQLHGFITVSYRNSRRSPITLIHGIGGIGKSQLALEYAHRNRDRFDSVFWIDAQNVRSIQTSFLKLAQRIVLHYASKYDVQDPPYHEIAHHLGLKDIVNENGDIETDGLPASLFINAVKEWLERDGNKGWLLIFDNSDDLEYPELSTFFPDTLAGHIVITTRLRPTTLSSQEIYLTAMDEEESLKLFSRSCRHYERELGDMTWCCARSSRLCLTSLADPGAGVRIVQRLGYHPLAISQAASYVSKVGVSDHEYLRLLDCEIKKQADADRSSLAALKTYPESLCDMWEMSLGKLEAYDPPVVYFLNLCSCFACEDIPVEMLLLGMPQDLEFRQRLPSRISTLRSRDFVTSAPKAESLSIHYLTHKWLRERQSSISQELVLQQAILVIATAALAVKQPQSRLWVFEQEVVPHISACLHWKDLIFWYEAHLVGGHHWMALGIICEHWGRHDDAEQLFNLANNKTASICKPGLLQARLQLEIGTLYVRRRKFDEARKLLEGALSMTACVLKDRGGEGFEDASHIQLKSSFNCALIYGEDLGLVEAEPQFTRVLEKSEALYGLNHPQTVQIVDTIAMKYQEHGQYEKAGMAWRRVLLALKEHLGPEGPIILYKQCALANVCQMQGRYGEAEKLYRHALAIYERRLGVNHPSSLNMASKLAIVSDLQGNFEESRRLYEYVLVGRQWTLGPHHPKTLEILENQALSHRMKGEYEEAEQLYRRLLRSREKNMDSQVDTQRTATKLADLCMERDRLHQPITVQDHLYGDNVAAY